MFWKTEPEGQRKKGMRQKTGVETTPARRAAKDYVITQKGDGLPVSKQHLDPGGAVPVTGG